MPKKKKAVPADDVKLEQISQVERVEHSFPVEKLEEMTKCGFYAERLLNKQLGSNLVRLRCESKDAESDDFVLCPWVSFETLSQMLYGCIYLHPAIMQVIKTVQANAPKPEGE